jgi:hypothetical protein
MDEAQIFQVKKQLDTNIDIQHFSATLSQKLFVQVSSGIFFITSGKTSPKRMPSGIGLIISNLHIFSV